MNAVEVPLTEDAVVTLLRDAGADGTTFDRLAEDLRLTPDHAGLRLIVARLGVRGLIRRSGYRLVATR